MHIVSAHLVQQVIMRGAEAHNILEGFRPTMLVAASANAGVRAQHAPNAALAPCTLLPLCVHLQCTLNAPPCSPLPVTPAKILRSFIKGRTGQSVDIYSRDLSLFNDTDHPLQATFDRPSLHHIE